MVFLNFRPTEGAPTCRCWARGVLPVTPALTPSRSLELRRRSELVSAILNTPTHQGGLADRRRPTRANHRQTTLGRRPRPSQNRPLCLTIVGIHLWRIWQSGNDLARTWQRLGMPEIAFCRPLRASWRRFGIVLEVLESALEALGGVLEGLDGVLEAMLDQDSIKMTNKSKNI